MSASDVSSDKCPACSGTKLNPWNYPCRACAGTGIACTCGKVARDAEANADLVGGEFPMDSPHSGSCACVAKSGDVGNVASLDRLLPRLTPIELAECLMALRDNGFAEVATKISHHITRLEMDATAKVEASR